MVLLELLIVFVALIVLALVVVFVYLLCLYLVKKRRSKRDRLRRPLLLHDKQTEKGQGLLASGKAKSSANNNKRRFARKTGAKSKIKDPSIYDRPFRDRKLKQRDPFNPDMLDNPMADDDFDTDWSNPAFDAGRSQVYDAAVTIQTWYRMIRVRIPFLEYKDAAITVQTYYRRWAVKKMLPRLKKEKHQRDQQKRKQAGWKKKGTLASLKYYDVKGYGFAEVEQLYGMDIVRDAADQLKSLYGGKGKMRLKLFISIKGIKLFDYYTLNHFATVKVQSVSFCTLDPKNKKIFAFINRKKKRNFCHVFQTHEGDAQKMVETIAEAFEVTFQNLEKKKEEQRKEKLVKMKQTFHHQSQELDVEVASMLQMAETASISTPLNCSRQMLHIAELHTDTTTGNNSGSSSPSLSGSREKLVPSKGGKAKESGLLVSTVAKPKRQKISESVSQVPDPDSS